MSFKFCRSPTHGVLILFFFGGGVQVLGELRRMRRPVALALVHSMLSKHPHSPRVKGRAFGMFLVAISENVVYLRPGGKT